MTLLLQALLLPYSVLNIYLNSSRRELLDKQVNALHIGFMPILVLNPIIFFVMYFFGLCRLPENPWFYFYFILNCHVFLLSAWLSFQGLSRVQFGMASGILATSVIWQSLFAVIFLNERMSAVQWGCFIIITLMQLHLNYRKHRNGLDIGVLMLCIAVILNGVLCTIFKYTTILGGDYWEFMTGRIVVDCLVYSHTSLWIAYYYRKSLFASWSQIFQVPAGGRYVFLHGLYVTCGTVFFYFLPSSYIAIIATIATPVAFLIGSRKFQEKSELINVVECFLLIFLILVFILNGL